MNRNEHSLLSPDLFPESFEEVRLSDDWMPEAYEKEDGPPAEEEVPVSFPTEDEEERNFLTTYFKEMNQYSLMTPDEEKRIGKVIMDTEKSLWKLILEAPVKTPAFNQLKKDLSRWLEKADSAPQVSIETLLKQIQEVYCSLKVEEDKDPKIALLCEAYRHRLRKLTEHSNQMVQANLRLGVNLAKQFTSRGLNFMDLIQEANLGLLKAVLRFDYRKGYRFSTFASWWIRQTIIRSIYDHSRTIRIPVHFLELRNRFYRGFFSLTKELGREPTPEEITRRTGLDGDKIFQITTLSDEPISLETPVGEDGEVLGDFMENRSGLSPWEEAERKERLELTQKILKCLTAREQEILKLRFGLNGAEEHTLEEVGKKFSLSRERIRQIEQKALRRLRHPNRRKMILGYGKEPVKALSPGSRKRGR